MGLVGIVLAAGEGRRLGGPKVEVVLGGQTLVARATSVLLGAGLPDVVVITGASSPVVPIPAVVVSNPRFADGMGSSLRCGLQAAIERGADAVLVTLVDQPGIGIPAVTAILDAYRGGSRIAQATFDGRRGHPVLIGAEHFEEAASVAQGDAGARKLLGRAAEEGWLTLVDCEGDDRDLDTPSDLERWMTQFYDESENPLISPPRP